MYPVQRQTLPAGSPFDSSRRACVLQQKRWLTESYRAYRNTLICIAVYMKKPSTSIKILSSPSMLANLVTQIGPESQATRQEQTAISSSTVHTPFASAASLHHAHETKVIPQHIYQTCRHRHRLFFSSLSVR